MVDTTSSRVPVKLEYNDATDGTTTIATMFTGGADDLLNTATLSNGGIDYSKLVIEGDANLQDRMPVSEQSFGDARNGESEPEIIVKTDTGNGFKIRDRVFALDGGNVDDNGKYKNKKLYGHKKYLGNQRVEVTTPVTTHIVDALEQVLPSGYTVDAPPEGDITGGYPEVNDYTFKGPRQNAFTDLSTEQGTLNEKWLIIFTAELDANNDYKVRFEPQGFGGSEGNIVRRDDPITYDYWRKKDASTVVSQVTAKAKDSNGNVLQVTESASSPDITNQKTLNIDYRVGNSTELSNLAQANLQPDFIEHGKLEGPLYIENTVNFSIGILDNQLDIDDEFTVVKQKDFFHEGRTSFSFEFENNANIASRVGNKKNQGQYDQLFDDSEENVGGQDLEVGDASAQTTSSSTADTAEAQTTSSSSLSDFTLGTGIGGGSESNSSLSLNGSISFTYFGGVAQFRIYEIKIRSSSGNGDVRIQLTQGGTTVWDSVERIFSSSDRVFQVPYLPNQSLSDDVEVFVEDLSSISEVSIESNIVVEAGGGTVTTNTNDSGHGAPDDPSTHSVATSTNDSGHGSSETDPHGGSTGDKNINITQEENTSR